jgi:hypothetical protein
MNGASSIACKQVWVGGGLLALCNMHPSVRSVQRGHLCPGRAPARARSADEERRPPARGNREPAPLPRRAPPRADTSTMGGACRPAPPGADTRLSGPRRADSRKESDTSARAAPRERARDLSRQAAHKCSVKVSSLTLTFQLSDQHVSGIESGETQNTRTQHSLVCAQPVDSQSQRLAHAPKVPPHERHRGTQCHGCRPPKCSTAARD